MLTPPPLNGGAVRCSGRLISSCTTSGSCRVTLEVIDVTSHIHPIVDVDVHHGVL